MRTDSMAIGQQRFWLPHGQTVDTLRQEVLEAVRSGGGIVHFTELGGGDVTAVISPGVVVIFESKEHCDDTSDAGSSEEPFDFFSDY